MVFWQQDNAKIEKAAPFSPLPSATQTEVVPSVSGALVRTPHSALGAGTFIHGKLRFNSAVSIDGKLDGEILSTETVVVGESGELNADIDVKCLIINGKVSGKVRASERIDLRAGGSLEGEISTPMLSIEPGAHFNGQCRMEKEPAALPDLDSHLDYGDDEPDLDQVGYDCHGS